MAVFLWLFPFFLAVPWSWLLMILVGAAHAELLSALAPVGFMALYGPVLLCLYFQFFAAMVKEALFGD